MTFPFWKTTVRHLLRHQTYTVLSAGGLLVGIVTSLLIFLWSFDEWSYDKQHPDNKRVFRIFLNSKQADGQILTTEETPALLADYMKRNVPEVEEVCRTGYWERKLLSVGDRSAFYYGRFSDPTFVSLFNMNLISGDIRNLLPDNQSIVISRTIANTLFDHGDAIGKFIQVDKAQEMKVTGVFEDHPRISSLSEEFLMPMSFHLDDTDLLWQNANVATYVKLKDAESGPVVMEKIKYQINTELKNDENSLFLFALTDWRLHGRFVDGKSSGGRIDYVIAFSIIALFILVMACINYMNLATARAAMRAKEIGVRKMSGATRSVLIKQFMSESMAITFGSAAASLLVVYLILPLFATMTGKNLKFVLADPVMLGGLFGIALVAGLVAGSYPAFILSSLKPSSILKGNLYDGLTGASLRKGLVVFQFALSLILICAAVIIQQQVDFLRTRDLGFDRNNVLYIEPGQDRDLPVETFRTEALRHPNIMRVSEGAASPMEINGTGTLHWAGDPTGEGVTANYASCDYDYFQTLGFSFVKGRNFSPDIASDSSAYVITEKAAELMGGDPVGRMITSGNPGEIIGVIRDFHNADIHETTAPVVFNLGNKESFGHWRRVFVRYEPGTLNATLDNLTSILEKLQPGIPPEFGFLDRDFDAQFRSDNLIGNLAIWFTFIAVAIACLGLFGLSLFNTQRRTKEIGVRKVLGASNISLIIMFCRDFSRPVIISIFIAVPIAWWLLEKFLERYPWHMNLPWLSFVITSLSLLSLAMLTVSYQSYRAARQNPVEALKTE